MNASFINIVVSEVKTDEEHKVVFTTNNKVASSMLRLICDDANITSTRDEYHYKGWVDLKKSKLEDKHKKHLLSMVNDSLDDVNKQLEMSLQRCGLHNRKDSLEELKELLS